MKIYRLDYSQLLPISRTECWKFFSDPQNLQKITPPEMNFKIKSELSPEIYPGQIIIYQIKLFPGLKLKWVTEITHVNEENYFVDEQRFGPYKFWHHQHLFKEVDEGMKINDIVHYSIAPGFLGRIMNKLFIRSKLENIFKFRKEYLNEMFKINQVLN
ncbi:MAG TPA: SRPBCC family protein [Ignavibacteriaceae bacterium]|nr:SRPBCC family protein [Ignavibacteriaceae bacterium]